MILDNAVLGKAVTAVLLSLFITDIASLGVFAKALPVNHQKSFLSPDLQRQLEQQRRQNITPELTCDSPIFCSGPLLQAVQLSGIFPDDKTFVDKPTLRPESEVLAAFRDLPNPPSRQDIQSFVDTYFGDEYSIIKPAQLDDFNPNPNFLKSSQIRDQYLSGFGGIVHNFWTELAREQDLSGLCDGCVTSVLPIKRKFVVPGGRFREFYYWDSYFIIEGLLVSELYDMAKDMLLNFFDLFDQVGGQTGFIPNGARTYFLNRSQPPFLSLMVDIYYQATGDKEILEKAMPILIREHDFWVNNRSITIKDPERFGQDREFNFFIFNVTNAEPRPEGYSVDYYAARNATSGANFTSAAAALQQQQYLYAQYASGAESGEDFTARWSRDPGLPNQMSLRSLQVNKIIPPELNSLIYALETNIGKFGRILGPKYKKVSLKYQNLAANLRKDMTDFMLNNSTGLFDDWNIEDGKFTGIYSVNNIWPYWQFGKDFGNTRLMKMAFSNFAALVYKFPGGVPTTLIDSGLQWDFPDAWPPHQYIVIRALQQILEGVGNSTNNNNSNRDLSIPMANDVPLRAAQNYINNIFCSWYATGGSIPGVLDKLPSANDTGHIYEKYDATVVGQPAGGGEYTVQVGFGWSNGVALWALKNFGENLSRPNCTEFSNN
ncbi:hypothetical protein H4219_005306 [Mycoemilia scoparia]|uniref:Trehalase n=1 Tax=Mycoemilia scoparia TaxID=417184 RepID=A0A9W7ZUG3_9FUNG|nr:hypothetical protein H4219_005306 [Mycoemilia scoparia]